MKLLSFNNLFIYEQLQIEEQLLRTSDENFCLINAGSKPAVVMGISSKAEEMLTPAFFEQDEIALIKRYSGGGTVIVDESTLFFTLICNKADWDHAPYPEPIMRSIEPLLKYALPNVRLHQHDFVIGERKCAGNAQMITKERFVHHISLLWDYKQERMNYLKLPQRQPDYRSQRPHTEFLYPLKNELSFESLKSRLTMACQELLGAKEALAPERAEEHRQATLLIS